MAKLTLAQVEYLSQQLTEQFERLKFLTSQACQEYEKAYENIRSLIATYDQWLAEEGLNNEPR